MIHKGLFLPTAVVIVWQLLTCEEASSFSVVSRGNAFSRRLTTPTSLYVLSSTDKEEDSPRKSLEFMDIEPLPEFSEKRRERIERDLEIKAQFAEFGDDLWELRSKMDQLSAKLVEAIQKGSETTEEKAREKLRDYEQRDPELVYMLELADLEEATADGRHQDAAKHKEKAMAARSCLPHFNLDGLWVGKYGNHGYELINITYAGDTLIATKVTGDKNVPRGEITFQVDLNPLRRVPAGGRSKEMHLQPVVLTEKAAQKWGTKKLPRYPGLGQVAEEGFFNNQWMDGQLIIIGDEYFSFAWIPIEQQIFFGRPSPELALKMLRDSGEVDLRSIGENFDSPPTVEDDVELQKKFVTRCLELTHEFEDDMSPSESNSLSCIWHDEDTEECYFE